SVGRSACDRAPNLAGERVRELVRQRERRFGWSKYVYTAGGHARYASRRPTWHRGRHAMESDSSERTRARSGDRQRRKHSRRRLIMTAIQPDYFRAYSSLKMSRDAQGVLLVELHSNGGPLTFTARDHTDFVDAFYRIGQDRANKVVIFAGTGGHFIAGIDFSSFGNVGDPEVWSRVHDEGVQVLENLLNIRVPVIAAVEGRLDVHSEYALLANVIVAGDGATFNDLPHFAAGIVPGDGIFTTWSYRAGAGRAEAFLLHPHPLSARTAY